jgi:hypothetical protein
MQHTVLLTLVSAAHATPANLQTLCNMHRGTYYRGREKMANRANPARRLRPLVSFPASRAPNSRAIRYSATIVLSFLYPSGQERGPALPADCKLVEDTYCCPAWFNSKPGLSAYSIR